MEKVAKKIEEELDMLRLRHKDTVNDLSDALERVEAIRGKMAGQEADMQRLGMEWETALYGASIPDYIYYKAEEIGKLVDGDMISSTYYTGKLEKREGNTISFPLFDETERELGELVLVPRRMKTGEVNFDLVYNRRDTTGRIRTYLDFELTSGIFEETLDLRRSIYAAIRHILAQAQV